MSWQRYKSQICNYCTHRRISLRSDWMMTSQCHNNSQILEDNCQGSWESPRTLLVLPDGCNNQYFEECLKFKMLIYKCDCLLFCRYVRYDLVTNMSRTCSTQYACVVLLRPYLPKIPLDISTASSRYTIKAGLKQ